MVWPISISLRLTRGGDWGHALNAYWSPLYSWLLALALHVPRPSAYAEFPVVHLVNLIIFVAALGCFDYFWREWIEDHQARTAAAGRTGWISLPPLGAARHRLFPVHLVIDRLD